MGEMTSVRREVQCVYCLASVAGDEVTQDHVIARSWYPANTPPVAKWKVPACRACNNRFSVSEDSVLNRLALCMNPKDPAIGHIVQRALRSTDPKFARSPRDIMHRFNKRQALKQGLIDVQNPKGPGLLPSFLHNFEMGSRTGIRVPAKALEEVVTKWIRGVYYCELGRTIPREDVVSVEFVNDDVAAEAFSQIIQFAKRVQKGPRVEVLIWHVEEGEASITQFAFNIWQQFRAYGSVESPAAADTVRMAAI